MMSSGSGAEETPSSATEANAPAVAVDAKLMVATASGDIQQLKDLLNREDSSMMVVVMASSTQAASTANHHPADMDPQLLKLASSGSSVELESLLGGQAPGNDADIEASRLILEGVTAEGDTALHVVATYGQGDNFSSTYTYVYGDGENFLESARIIYQKRTRLLFDKNNNGDTPLHCAARAGKSNMVACLIDLAEGERREGPGGPEGRVKELLEKENNHRETALHEAVRIGNNDIVKLLMEKDPDLGSFPKGGASPLYLAVLLKRKVIVETLYTKSANEMLSYSGQNGQNALHAAVLRGPDLTEMLLKWNEDDLRPRNKDLTTKRDENGSTPLHFAAAMSGVCRQVLEANADALYQPDHAGLFPVHVAASVDAFRNIDMFVEKCPSSAGLRNAEGKTFLHVAVEKKKVEVIRGACRNLSLSWIMNMRDDDGNTALHLAVKTRSLVMFCSLLGNPQVHLNLTNKEGETPLDIAQYKIPQGGLNHNQNSDAQIHWVLGSVGAMHGVRRKDHFNDNNTPGVKEDESKKMKLLKDSTQTLSIGSVLIASVTFGATFAVPGGYIADDHNNGGTPIFARRFAFDAFIVSNTLAFVFSAMATVGLMRSGSPKRSPGSRKIHFSIAEYSLSLSVKSLAAAFALGAYVVLAPVAHKTAVATCVLSSLVVPYGNLEFMWRRLVLLPPLCRRKGPIWELRQFAGFTVYNLLYHYWPLIFIFAWAAYASPAPKMEPPVQAPAPLA